MIDEVLPYYRFDYFAMQGTKAAPGVVAVSGTVFIFGAYATRDQIMEMCLNRAAYGAVAQGLSWNPFQVSLVFTPTK